MTLAAHERQLKQLIWRRWPFADIEERIERAELSAAAKSALWLCAWSFIEVVAERWAGCKVQARL